MTILYINDEHCTSVEQLRSYFGCSLNYDSPVFFDLIDYARSGDISSWLREKGESFLADNVDSIDGSLGDRDYFSRLSGLMTGVASNQVNPLLEKPDFSKCFHVEDMRQEQTSDGIAVSVQLKVLSVVNEPYEICVRTSWGTKAQVVNPFKEKVGGIILLYFSFRKRPYVEKNDALLLVDGREIREVGHADAGGDYLEFTVGDSSFKMIRVKSGTFMMGANDRSPNARPLHEVTLTEDYYIGEIPVTQKLWNVVTGDRPSNDYDGNLPVEHISWEMAKRFIKKLNKITGKSFRLPTEAEWEYAAKGGCKSKGYRYSGSNNINIVAWYKYNSGGKIHPVMGKMANELGIYDMSGNVLEWCEDGYDVYSDYPQTNPKGTHGANCRVYRGGYYSWDDYACEVTYRCYDTPDCEIGPIGFRLALSK